jgi:hypothetical protein
MNTPAPAAPNRAPANVDRWVMRIAGLFILASLALSQLHSVHWLWFTAFVGANMFQASITGFCPLAMILRKLGVKPGTAFPAPLEAR